MKCFDEKVALQAPYQSFRLAGSHNDLRSFQKKTPPSVQLRVTGEWHLGSAALSCYAFSKNQSVQWGFWKNSHLENRFATFSMDNLPSRNKISNFIAFVEQVGNKSERKTSIIILGKQFKSATNF